MAYPEGYPMIHPTLQDRDFELLNEGDPVFMDLDGGCKLFQRESTAAWCIWLGRSCRRLALPACCPCRGFGIESRDDTVMSMCAHDCLL